MPFFHTDCVTCPQVYFTQAPSNLNNQIAICAHPPKSSCTCSVPPLLLVLYLNHFDVMYSWTSVDEDNDFDGMASRLHL